MKVMEYRPGSMGLLGCLEESRRSDELKSIQNAFRERIGQIKNWLESHNKKALKVRRGIERLTPAGLLRDAAFYVLALQVAHQEKLRKPSWPKETRRHNRNLRSLAKRLRTIAAEVEEVNSKTESHLRLTEIMLREIMPQVQRNAPVLTESDPARREWVTAVRALADDLVAKANGLGELGKAENARLCRSVLPHLTCLALPMSRSGGAPPEKNTREVSERFQILAEIIATAYGAFHIPDPPNAESLRLMGSHHRP